MNDPKADLLRSCLQGIQAHAAGMHANAEMALRLLGEMRAGPVAQVSERAPQEMYGGRPAQHYGDPPADEIEQHLSNVESGGIASTGGNAAHTPPPQE